jgi:hypothetical protein
MVGHYPAQPGYNRGRILKLLDQGLQMLVKPKMLHATPGRIRFYLPLLKKLGGQHREFAEIARRLLEFPEGISTVSTSLVTGTVLVEYDQNSLSEEEVCGFVFSFNKAFFTQRENLAQLAQLDPEEIFSRLTRWLDGALLKRLHLDTSQRIPLDDLS